jgi:hypothetical protein
MWCLLMWCLMCECVSCRLFNSVSANKCCVLALIVFYMYMVQRREYLFSATMPIRHPRQPVARDPFDVPPVREWAPPGWHWELLPSGTRSLMRNQGPVVDPDVLWWRPYGPGSVQREPAPEEVVRRRVREEDEHVRRYMVALDVMFSRTWQYWQGPYTSCAPVMVPSLWLSTARGSAPGSRRPV